MRLIFAAIITAGMSSMCAAAELPLKRVVLSTSGLAQFTYSGEVAGRTVIEVSVRLDQVDDVLKSLTILDAAGSIGDVSLPGKAPLDELFRDLPFSRAALESQSALLNALAGSEVEIEGEVIAKGRVLAVEEETVQLPNNGGETKRHRLSLLSSNGFVQAILENVRALRFTDAQTRSQIERALAAIAQAHGKDRRTLSVNLVGEGARTAGLSYVVSAPVWKTAYRLVLPKEEGGGGKARLQGWGILENLTGGDWKDVELTLVSGNPVALRQPLYSAVFVHRPEIPVYSSARIVPRKDDAEEKASSAADAMLGRLPLIGSLRSASPPPPAPPAHAARSMYDRLSPKLAEELGTVALAAEAEEAVTQVLYRFPSKVTLASGATMMIPFADREITVSRTYLYQPETNQQHPLVSVRMKNDGDSALPAGIVTAFDTSAGGSVNFAGDAQLPLLGKGATKFVTFALDSRTAVRRSDRGTKETRIATALHGEMKVTVKSLWTIEYEIIAPADEDREIVIEEARADGWKTAGESATAEEMGNLLRYKVAAAKGQKSKAALVRERFDYQSVSLTSLGPDRLLATITGLQNQTPALKEAIAKLSTAVAEISRLNSHRRELESERRKIGEDQDRIRKNLGSVGQGSDLGRRYLDELKVQEDRLAEIGAAEKAIDSEIATKTKSAEEIGQGLVL
ncbi:MAG: DUF4139 domain-containing protein [Rhodomicrobium sp.]